MTAGHYVGAGRGWATGAKLVYRPLAAELITRSPNPLAGRTVLDAGAGTARQPDRPANQTPAGLSETV